MVAIEHDPRNIRSTGRWFASPVDRHQPNADFQSELRPRYDLRHKAGPHPISLLSVHAFPDTALGSALRVLLDEALPVCVYSARYAPTIRPCRIRLMGRGDFLGIMRHKETAEWRTPGCSQDKRHL